MSNFKQYQITKNDGVDVQYYSEFMQDYAQEQVVSGQSHLQALRLSDGSIGVFTLGQDQNLYLIRRALAVSGGWDQHILNTSKDGKSTLGKIATFGVAVVEEGHTMIGISLASDDPSTAPSLYVANAANFAQMDFETFDPTTFFNQQIPLPITNGTINNIGVSTNGASVAYAPNAQAQESPACYYCDLTNNTAQQQSLNTGATEIKQLEAGIWSNQAGTFVLYANGDDYTLEFLPFGSNKVNTTFALPNDDIPSSFSLGLTEDGDHAIYITGAGVYMITDKSKTPTTILAAIDGQSCSRINAASNGTTTALWVQMMQNGQEGLYLISNAYYQYNTTTPSDSVTVGEWNEPIQLLNNVVGYTALQGEHIFNQLFYINDAEGDNKLKHFWQDKGTTLWKDIGIPVVSTGAPREFLTYSMTLKFTTQTANRTFEGTTVSITPTSSVYASINNTPYTLMAGQTVDVELDNKGVLTIVNEIDTLQGPNFTVSADFLDDDVTLAMTQKVMDRLTTQSEDGGEDWLSTATKEDGSLLIPSGSIDPDTLSTLSQNIANFLAVNANLPSQGGDADNLSLVKRPQSWGMHFNAGAARMLTEEELADIRKNQLNSEGLIDGLGHVFGDVIHWAEDFLEDAFTLAVDVTTDVVTFTLNAIDKTATFIIDTVEQVFESIYMLLKKIGVVLEDIADFIGFLFHWDNFINTKDAISDLMQNGMDALNSEVDTLACQINGLLEDLRNKIPDNTLATHLMRNVDTTSGIMSEQYGGVYGSIDDNHPLDPKLNWVNTKVQYGDIKLPLSTGGDPKLAEAINSLFDSAHPILEQLEQDVEGLIGIFKSFFEGESTLSDFLTALIEEVGKISIDVAQIMVQGIADLIEKAVGALKTILTTEIDIPVFSWIYEKLVGAKPSILDLAAMLLSIPTTIGYRIAMGVYPIGDGDNQISAQAFSTIPQGLFNLGQFKSNDTASQAEIGSGSPAYDGLCDLLIASTRLLRLPSFLLVTAAALLPPEAEKGSGGDTESKGILKNFVNKYRGTIAKVSFASLIFDNIFRFAGMLIATVKSVSIKGIIYSFYFFVAPVINAGLHWLKGKIKEANHMIVYRVYGAIDALFVTILSVWNFIDTVINWPATQADQGAEISLEIFQILPLVSAVMNPAAAVEEDVDPVVDAIALGVFLIREGAMLSSSVCEFVYSGEQFTSNG